MREEELQSRVSEMTESFEAHRNQKEVAAQEQLKEQVAKNSQLRLEVDKMKGHLEQAINAKLVVEQSQDFYRVQYADSQEQLKESQT